MTAPNSKLFAPRKIGVCGSSKGLTSDAVKFCQAVGRRLAEEPLAKIVSGGTKRRANTADGDFAAEWYIVKSAGDAMDSRSISERIITMVRDTTDTPGFHIGVEQRSRGRTGEARRISFVRGIDGLIAVGGGGGTDQELALAIEHDIRVLPVPSFGGSARKYWDAYRSDLIKSLRIDEAVADRWEQAPGSDGIDALAREMIDALVRSLPRRCFVIMPFDENFDGLFDFVIAPAVRAAGDEPIRLDRVGTPGDVRRQIEDGIKNCEYVVAVLDNLRPNVLYELGIAHGRDKTTILMNRKGAIEETDGIPFDLSTLQRLEYFKVDASLPNRLTGLITSVFSQMTGPIQQT